MRMRETMTLVAFAAALAACSAEAPKEPGDAATDPVVADTPASTETADRPTTEGPAGEVAPGSREPVDARSPEKPRLPEGLDSKWAVYFEKIPFVFGAEAGLAKAAETGKPMMMFYSATW